MSRTQCQYEQENYNYLKKNAISTHRTNLLTVSQAKVSYMKMSLIDLLCHVVRGRTNTNATPPKERGGCVAGISSAVNYRGYSNYFLISLWLPDPLREFSKG